MRFFTAYIFNVLFDITIKLGRQCLGLEEQMLRRKPGTHILRYALKICISDPANFI